MTSKLAVPIGTCADHPEPHPQASHQNCDMWVPSPIQPAEPGSDEDPETYADFIASQEPSLPGGDEPVAEVVEAYITRAIASIGKASATWVDSAGINILKLHNMLHDAYYAGLLRAPTPADEVIRQMADLVRLGHYDMAILKANQYLKEPR